MIGSGHSADIYALIVPASILLPAFVITSLFISIHTPKLGRDQGKDSGRRADHCARWTSSETPCIPTYPELISDQSSRHYPSSPPISVNTTPYLQRPNLKLSSLDGG